MRRLLTKSSAIFEDTRSDSEPTHEFYIEQDRHSITAPFVDTYADPRYSKKLRRTSKKPTIFNMINARSFHMTETHTHNKRPIIEKIISKYM